MIRLFKNILSRISHRDTIGDLRRKGLVIGKNFVAQEEVIIDPSHCWHIVIGDDVTLAPRVHILAHDASTKRHLGYTRIGKVTIGNKVFVGASSLILPGVSIGSNVVIGAGSVVTGDIADNVVAAGNPAKAICTLESFLVKRKDEMQTSPCYEVEYTIRGNITERMKEEMNSQMKNRIGYIV